MRRLPFMYPISAALAWVTVLLGGMVFPGPGWLITFLVNGLFWATTTLTILAIWSRRKSSDLATRQQDTQPAMASGAALQQPAAKPSVPRGQLYALIVVIGVAMMLIAFGLRNQFVDSDIGVANAMFPGALLIAVAASAFLMYFHAGRRVEHTLGAAVVAFASFVLGFASLWFSLAFTGALG